MAVMTSFVMVTFTLLLLSPTDAQSPTSALPASIMDMINQLTNPSSPSAPSSSPQVSLVESFGPISSSTLHSGTQTAVDPFASPQSGAATSSSKQQQQKKSSGGGGTGASVAKLFGSGLTRSGGAAGSSANALTAGGSTASLPASDPLNNDILSNIQAFINRASPYSPPPGGNGSYPPPPISPSGMGPGLGGPVMNSDFSAGGGFPGMMRGGPMGPGPDLMPPLSPLGGLMPGPVLNAAQSQAMLNVGRRLGQKFGVNMYYEIHGCEDPTLLFSGRQKAMAAMAMAQGCHSPQAMHVCRMAQVKERLGHSLLTSRLLPPHVTARLESCLSAKVLFSPLHPSPSPSPLPMGILSSLSFSTGPPSFRECGMLLSTVMDGGSLDPETMSSTRRTMLPWSCNESNMGPNNIPYRVCCPGKVMEPTLQEAQIVRRMINA